MPHFFIDITSGADFVRDVDGADYKSFEAARKEAIITLGDVSRSKVTEDDYREFNAVVRDANDRPVFRATLSLILDEIER